MAEGTEAGRTCHIHRSQPCAASHRAFTCLPVTGGIVMASLPFIVIDGKLHLWKEIVALRRTQLAALEAAKATQLALFETLHDDRRPAAERTASGRYQQPSLFDRLDFTEC